MSGRFDVAVVGSGFAGSLTAMIARRVGLSAVLIERGHHPRVVVGESSTPLSNLLLEELTERYDLPNLRSLSKWGSWRASHPEIACGLKRGFSFLKLSPGQDGPVTRDRQLLVAASPHNRIADTHWYRADFDEYFVHEAERAGVEYFDETELREFSTDGRVAQMVGVRGGHEMNFSARFVVDATGPHGFLHRALKLGTRPLPDFPATQGLYCHFTGVRRLDESGALVLDGDPPYPIDDAAVHHIFDGGWVWVLRFSNGVASAGLAATDALADELKLTEGAAAWRRLLDRFPVMRDQFAGAEPVQPFRHIPRLSFRSAVINGPNWALLPSAAGFVDPLLSTGFPMTLLGISRLGEIFERYWGREDFAAQLANYAAQADADLLAAARLLGALYASFDNFPLFTALSLLYFAAVSYTETARRLGKPELASSYLLRGHPQFGPESAHVFARAHTARGESEVAALIEDIYRVIEPIDVAGLSNRARRNWFPVEAEDLFANAGKVHAGRDEIKKMFDRCGFDTKAFSQVP